MERGSAIVLIGFMGAGKSTVGRVLAERTGFACYDTDAIVSARAGLTIPEIFAERGEEYFRELETGTLAQIPAEPAIVVTGGGIILRPGSVKRLRALGRVVYLTAEEETLFARASRDGMRPLLQSENPRATFSQLLRVRAPLYQEAADFSLDTSGLEPEEIADAILQRVQPPDA